MKKIFLPIFAITFFCMQTASAQNIAFNQDGSAPDTSAMLDISSSNKGFLMPRLTTAQQSAITTPATGLMLFNSSVNAFQYNSGTSVTPAWSTISAVKERTNFVLVKTATDLPAPVAGIITLLPTTIYEVNGTIVLTNKIDLNGSWITGADAVNDKLVYTPSSGELFTGANGGNIRNLTLTAATAGSKLFNVDGAGANKNFIVQNCYIIACNNIGKIRGYGGTVYLQTVAFFYNVNGITYENDNNVIVSNALWDKTNYNTFETFAGTFNVIQKIAGAMEPVSANSGKALNVAGITSIVSGELKVVLFTGNGTYITGTFSKQWEVESTGVSTEKDDVASGNLYVTGTSGTTNFSTVNTATKLVCATTGAGLFRVTSPAANRLTYAGTKTRRFAIFASLSVTASSYKNFSFFIYKNGVRLPESEQTMRLGLGIDKGSISLNCTTQLAANDYIEVWAANLTDATDLIVDNMNITMR